MKVLFTDLRAESPGSIRLWSNQEKKDVGPMVHDPDFRPIRGLENLNGC